MAGVSRAAPPLRKAFGARSIRGVMKQFDQAGLTCAARPPYTKRGQKSAILWKSTARRVKGRAAPRRSVPRAG